MGLQTLPAMNEILSGRSESMALSGPHYVSGYSLRPPYPAGMGQAVFGLGCFWGAERKFWQLHGVYVTTVGYAGGITPNPTYEEVCSGLTAHAEVVQVVFDPGVVSYEELLSQFWEAHDPTQGMRQGNDRGTQYRSIILVENEGQREQALSSRQAYQGALSAQGAATITTEIQSLDEYYFAEAYHQQYLAKNPGGYCGLGGTGVSYPQAG